MQVDNHCPGGYWDPRTLWPEFEPLGHFNPVEDMQAVFDLVRMSQGEMSQIQGVPWAFYDNVPIYGHRAYSPAVIEIGTWMGQVARMLAEHGAKVFCVDHWEGNDDHLGGYAGELGSGGVYRRFCENVKPHLLERVFPLHCPSDEAAESWPHPAQADMVFIDACHDYESTRYDILTWEPMIRPGGIICGHDYGATIQDADTGERKQCGVRQAVDELGLAGVLGKSVWWRRVK